MSRKYKKEVGNNAKMETGKRVRGRWYGNTQLCTTQYALRRAARGEAKHWKKACNFSVVETNGTVV